SVLPTDRLSVPGQRQTEFFCPRFQSNPDTPTYSQRTPLFLHGLQGPSGSCPGTDREGPGLHLSSSWPQGAYNNSPSSSILSDPGHEGSGLRDNLHYPSASSSCQSGFRLCWTPELCWPGVLCLCSHSLHLPVLHCLYSTETFLRLR